MSKNYFRPEPSFSHQAPISDRAPCTTAVVLVNLGTPDAPTAAALRRYLAEFLGDPRVVEMSRPLWWLILHGIILNVRPKKSAAKYASIWTEQGSPLRVYTEQQATALQNQLTAAGYQVTVTWAMRYGTPAIPDVLDQLKAQRVRRVLIVPLYPQYSATTTATVMDKVCAWLLNTRNQPELRTIRHFHDDPNYITALATQVEKHWQTHGTLGAGDKLLMSFHGLPKRYLQLGDPYSCECRKTARLLAERLGLSKEQYVITFQSRFGKEEWLQPYTADTVQQLAQQGCKRLDVICPGFVSDCLETLEEIAQEVQEDFLHAGGQTFHYIPCLNNEPTWLAALQLLVQKHLQGWE